MDGCGGVAREALRAGQAFEVANKATVIIAKQRQGATGSVHMRFDRQFTKFSDLAHKAY
jgi:replicative DNA helicase